jgi:hypothetical protein
MVRLFVIGLIAAALSSNAVAQPTAPLFGSSRMYRRQPVQYSYTPPQSNLDRKVDGHTDYNIGRAVEYPAGDAKLYATLTVSDDWQSDPLQVAVRDWFNNDPRLMELRRETKFNFYNESNPHFRERLGRYYSNQPFPLFTIQSPDGYVFMHVTAKSFPRTAGELADKVYLALKEAHSAPRVATDTPLIYSDSAKDCGPGPDCRPPVAPPFDSTDRIDERMPDGGSTSLLLIGLAAAALVAVLAFMRKRPTAARAVRVASNSQDKIF